MRRILQALSWLALAGTIGPAVLYLMGRMQLDAMKTSMLVAGIAWFVVTPMWMERKTGG